MNRIPPMVSIIMPMYNADKYVELSILSAQKQCLKELELICIDDGSTDATEAIVLELQKKDERIIYLKQNHRGSGAARNLGIQKASGKYVMFLDADDLLEDTDALGKMVEACEAKNVFICGSYRKKLVNGIKEDMPLFREYDIPNPEGRLFEFKEFQYDHDYQSFIFNREFLIENNICFPDYWRYQDPPFFLNAMVAAEKFYVVPMILYCYRVGPRNKKVVNDNIKDILRGIRDTLRIAVQGDYEKLYLHKLRQMEVVYRTEILSNLSDDVMELLLEISRVNKTYEKGREISIFKEIYGENERLESLKKSYELHKSIIRILQTPDGFKKYFEEKDIKNVVVYGVGYYGKMLINILKQAGIRIICCVDSKVDAYEEFKIIKPQEQVPKCDMLLVSMLDSQEVITEYKNRGTDKVFTFGQLIEEIEKR